MEEGQALRLPWGIGHDPVEVPEKIVQGKTMHENYSVCFALRGAEEEEEEEEEAELSQETTEKLTSRAEEDSDLSIDSYPNYEVLQQEGMGGDSIMRGRETEAITFTGSSSSNLQPQDDDHLDHDLASRSTTDYDTSHASAGMKVTRENAHQSRRHRQELYYWLGHGQVMRQRSMRREKEWRRTLACKLFEERHNAGGVGNEEGSMDLLWEVHEKESSKNHRSEDNNNNNNKGIHRRKDDYSCNYNEEEEEEDDVYKEDDGGEGQVFCLQALKLSTEKVNLGMGRRPNLVTISNVLKRIGWLRSKFK